MWGNSCGGVGETARLYGDRCIESQGAYHNFTQQLLVVVGKEWWSPGGLSDSNNNAGNNKLALLHSTTGNRVKVMICLNNNVCGGWDVLADLLSSVHL